MKLTKIVFPFSSKHSVSYASLSRVFSSLHEPVTFMNLDFEWIKSIFDFCFIAVLFYQRIIFK